MQSVPGNMIKHFNDSLLNNCDDSVFAHTHKHTTHVRAQEFSFSIWSIFMYILCLSVDWNMIPILIAYILEVRLACTTLCCASPLI